MQLEGVHVCVRVMCLLLLAVTVVVDDCGSCGRAGYLFTNDIWLLCDCLSIRRRDSFFIDDF